MDDTSIQELWKAYDRKLEESRILNMQSWALNIQSFEAIHLQKAKTKLNRLATYKKWMIAAGVLWVWFLGFILYHSLPVATIFFVVSLSCIILFTIIAIIVYIRHVILIRQIDNSDSIVDTQQKLARLQSSTMNIARVLWLQMPFYCTFYITPEMIRQGGWPFWLITVPVVLLFSFAAIWLYRNINYKNSHKKWFKIMFSSTEWTSVIKAMEFVNEIEVFKKEV